MKGAHAWFASLVGLVMGGFIASCADRAKEHKEDGLSVREHVLLECADLRDGILRSAETYKEFAHRLEGKTPGTPEYDAAVDHLARSSIGYSRDVRDAKLREIKRRFAFCLTVRKRQAKEGMFTSVMVRLDNLDQRLATPTPDGHTPTPEEVVLALTEMAALANEVNELPLVE